MSGLLEIQSGTVTLNNSFEVKFLDSVALKRLLWGCLGWGGILLKLSELISIGSGLATDLVSAQNLGCLLKKGMTFAETDYPIVRAENLFDYKLVSAVEGILWTIGFEWWNRKNRRDGLRKFKSLFRRQQLFWFRAWPRHEIQVMFMRSWLHTKYILLLYAMHMR